MQLTVYSDYALRLLMFLAIEPGRIATLAEVSDAYKISRNHLVKIAQRLGQAGIIQSIRGRQGGVRLAQEPAKIGIGHVVRVTERNLALAECFDREGGGPSCTIVGMCPLQAILDDALEAFFAVLDRHTLADAIDDGGVLATFFGF